MSHKKTELLICCTLPCLRLAILPGASSGVYGIPFDRNVFVHVGIGFRNYGLMAFGSNVVMATCLHNVLDERLVEMVLELHNWRPFDYNTTSRGKPSGRRSMRLFQGGRTG